jgi:hypothetical protein
MQDLGIDLRRFDILVSEELLDPSDVMAALKQACREGVAGTQRVVQLIQQLPFSAENR